MRAHYELAEQTDRSSPYDLLGRRQRRRKSSTKKEKKENQKGNLLIKQGGDGDVPRILTFKAIQAPARSLLTWPFIG